MKINEFIKRVNKVFYAEYSYDSDTLYVYRTEQDMCDENNYGGDDTYYFMCAKICDKKFSLFFDPDWMPEDVKGLALLFGLLRELEDTPVNDRFPEKKYYLRWIDDKDGTPNYIDFDSNAGWNIWHKSASNTFTESQLEQLKIDHPLFASMIDAMKEPAKENE